MVTLPYVHTHKQADTHRENLPLVFVKGHWATTVDQVLAICCYICHTMDSNEECVGA